MLSLNRKIRLSGSALKSVRLFSTVKNLFLGAFMIGMAGCATVPPAVKRNVATKPSDFTVWTPDTRSDESKNSYRFTLKTPENTITGLVFLKKNGDEWRGTLMNEMSVKAFDFKVTDSKCELLHVIPLMDKWYIKKTVASDIHFLIHVDNPNAPYLKKAERFVQNEIRVVNYQKKQLLIKPNGDILLINRRHNLQYEWRKMLEIDPDKVIL